MTSHPRKSRAGGSRTPHFKQSAGPEANRTWSRTRPEAPPHMPPTEDKVLTAILSFFNRLPKPYRRIPQPWHFIAKAATLTAFAYIFWGPITHIVSAILSALLMLAVGAFGLAMVIGMFKYSVSEEGRREEERWYEENDPRGNGPRGAL
jgi:hypothetical protein